MAEKEGITIDSKELDAFLSSVLTNLDKASQNIINDLADISLNEIKENYSKSEYEASEYMDFIKTGTKDDITVKMAGPQAIYSEFGTGTRGQEKPHPKKNDFNLNPYNSGKTIREATSGSTAESRGIKVGDLYWTYKDAEGNKQYTQGIPAQMQVYKAGKKAISDIPSVIEKNLKGMFKKS